MKGRMCQVEHNPPHSHGDCVRACIATMIDRDDVPHAYLGQGAEEAWVTLRKYLAENGKYLALFALEDDVFEFMSMNNPNIPYMLLCRTATADHAVVCVNDSVTHDPNNSKSEIIGKHSIGFWIVGIIGEV